jgi:hypothetical protein
MDGFPTYKNQVPSGNSQGLAARDRVMMYYGLAGFWIVVPFPFFNESCIQPNPYDSSSPDNPYPACSSTAAYGASRLAAQTYNPWWHAGPGDNSNQCVSVANRGTTYFVTYAERNGLYNNLNLFSATYCPGSRAQVRSYNPATGQDVIKYYGPPFLRSCALWAYCPNPQTQLACFDLNLTFAGASNTFYLQSMSTTGSAPPINSHGLINGFPIYVSMPSLASPCPGDS